MTLCVFEEMVINIIEKFSSQLLNMGELSRLSADS